MSKIISIVLAILQILIALFFGESTPPDGVTDIVLPGEVKVDERVFTQHPEIKGYIYNNGTTQLPFRLAEPETKSISGKYPLVVYLHGSGDRGSDNKSQVMSLMINSIKNYGDSCYIFMPQINTSSAWNSNEIDSVLNQCIDDFLIKNLPIDTSRIYIVGISLGGNGVFTQIERHPGKFAAAVSASGFYSYVSFMAVDYSPFVNIPIWLAHNSGDSVVPVRNSRDIYNGVKALGGNKIRYTEYTSSQHNSWSTFFAESELWNWLFSKSN